MRRFQAIKDWTPGYINVTPAHLDIAVECAGRGQQREFDKQSLPNTLRHALIVDIERRLKCSTCGAKAGKMRFGHFADE